MKLRPSVTWFLALPFLSPTLSLAQAAAGPAPAAPNVAQAPAQDDDKQTDLEKRMSRMARALRKLKKQVADPAHNSSSLQLVATMQAAAKEAIDLTPAKAADLPADQQAKFVDDYRAGMKGMQDEFAKLSDALTAGKNADAVKIVAEIDALEKKDHKEFRKPKKD
jgi:soluble cytochrome b562